MRFAKNRTAIETYNAILDDNRQPSEDERDALSAYIGWGSFGQDLFQGSWEHPIYKDDWKDENNWLREHLGEVNWKSAQASIINAHYTDPPTVGVMWDMARRLGFKGGRVLEPSMGIGNFFGLMPADLMENSELTGIEMDKLTGGMAKMLYPAANIQIKPYQDSKTADDFYDLVIGNWPFAKVGPSDRRYNKLNPTLHDYFFLKALDQVRPGGLVIGITSAGTMDKLGSITRATIEDKAKLIKAIRLPTGAFEKYAGTNVVTDILILQKREAGDATPSLSKWANSVPLKDDNDREMHRQDGSTVNVNEYWSTWPENVLGTLTVGRGTTYGRDGMIVKRLADFADEMGRISRLLPDYIMTPRVVDKNIRYVTNNTSDRQNSVVIGDSGSLYAVKGEQLVSLDDLISYRVKDAKETAKREDQIKRLVGMRKAYGALIDAERSGTDDTEALRKELKKQYEGYVNQHGLLNKSYGLSALRSAADPMEPAIAALEVPEMVNGKPTDYRPATILIRATVRSRKKLENPSVSDAFVLTRNDTATHVDMDRIAELSKNPVSDVVKELVDSGAVYPTPSGNYEVSDVYLSGNVRRKLREALEAQDSGQDMTRNIEALKKILPKTIPYFAIEAKLGATWVASDYYQDFFADLLGVTQSEKSGIEVRPSPIVWKIKLEKWMNAKPEAQTLHGVPFYPFSRVLDAAMNNTSITIKGKDEDGNAFVLTKETEQANAKVAALREGFGQWLWKDAERRIALESSYNEVMNAIAIPHYDGSFMAFDGMALQRGDHPFNLRKHQVDDIWRGVANGRGLYAHEVGTGKTLTMGGICVESRRYGLARKPMILAHNANSASVAREIQEMYPGARVLYIDNLAPASIKQRMYQIANDDWDAVVVPHSLINRFALTAETLDDLTREEILALENEAIEAAEEDGGSLDVAKMGDDKEMRKVRSVTAKELVKQRNAILKKNADMALQASREDAVTFEQLGIDMLVIDEAHEFKKPPLTTRMRLKGLNTSTSGESLSLHLLASFVRRLNNGKGVHIFTGTPITNTLNEIYNQMRYVAAEDMEEAGVKSWDSWFNTFADSSTDVELTPAGDYEPQTRLASFVNVAELRRMAGQYMSIVFADDMPEFKPRTTQSGKTAFDPELTDAERDELLQGRTENPIGRPYKKTINDTGPMTERQKAIRNHLAQLSKEFKNASGKERRHRMITGHESSPLKVETNASKAGFDTRLYDLSAPDEPGSKINRCVDNVLGFYKHDGIATQVIFMDKGYSDHVDRTTTVKGIKSKTRHPSFNAAKDIVNKLVEGGIPREQIAVVTGSTSKEKRKDISDAMNASQIRVVIGGTSTLGIGVNMQNNLRAMHHLDAPWMPGELEQRNGRGHRQGNTWNTVFEYRYLTEGLDGRRWQVLAIKDKFIKSFLKADESVRVIEGDAVSLDDENGNSEFAESLSAAAGDPRLLMREKLKTDVNKLENKQRMHDFGVTDAKHSIAGLMEKVERQKAWLSNARDDALHLVNEKDKPFSLHLNGKTYNDRKEGMAALDSIASKLMERGKKKELGTFKGFTISLYSRSWDGGKEITLERKTQSVAGITLPSLEATLRGIAQKAGNMVEDINDNERSIAQFREAAKTPFGQAATLEKKKAMLAQVSQDIELYPAPAPHWLIEGAPVGTDVYLPPSSDNPPHKVVVQGHRWGTEGWYVIVDSGEDNPVAVSYQDVRDENNMPVFAPRKFESPVLSTRATASYAQKPSHEQTPNGLKAGQTVSYKGTNYTVTRVIPPDDDLSRPDHWNVEIEREEDSQIVDADSLLSEQSPQFSLDGASSGQTTDTLRAELGKAGFREAVKSLEGRGLLHIVERHSQLPLKYRLGSTTKQRVQGVFDGKSVWMVAENIPKGNSAGVFLHEAGEHQNLRAMLGDKLYSDLGSQFGRLLKNGDSWAQRAADSVPQNTPAADVLSERLAYLIEHVTNADEAERRTIPGAIKVMVQRALAALRAWFYRSPFARILELRGIRLDVSPRDIAALARAAVGRNIGEPIRNTGELGSAQHSETEPASTPLEMRDHAPGWLLGLFQRNHIIDMYGKDLPELAKYKELTREREAYVQNKAQEADTLYKEYRSKINSQVAAQLADVQTAATVAEYEPDAKGQNHEKPINAEQQNLVEQFKALPLAAKEVYRSQRDTYRATVMARKQAIADRINEHVQDVKTRRQILDEIDNEFSRLLSNGVYFPLARHGDYVAIGRQFIGDSEDRSERVVSYADTEEQARELGKEMAEQGYEVDLSTRKVYNAGIADNRAAASMLEKVSKALKEIGDEVGVDDRKALLDSLHQDLIAALPDASYRKHFIHRKKVKGYSTDMLRAFAQTQYASAQHIANIIYRSKIQKQISETQKRVSDMRGDKMALQDVVNELVKRESQLTKNQINPIAASLSQLGFIGAMGFNVSSALVNLMQVPAVTFPHLAGVYGANNAATELMKASRLILNRDVIDKESGFNLLKHPAMQRPENADLKEALVTLEKSGDFSLTMAHDLIEMGRRKTFAETPRQQALDWVAQWSGYPFHVAEAVNRQTSAIAAFRLEHAKQMQDGADSDTAKAKALLAAKDTLDRTHFDYTVSNRSRFMMGNNARVLTLFKQYALGISYFIGRNAYLSMQGATPEEKKIARHTIAWTMGVGFVTSGLFGLPLGMESATIGGGVAGFQKGGKAGALMGSAAGMAAFQALVAGLGGDDDDDLKAQFRAWAAETFGKGTGEALAHGPLRSLLSFLGIEGDIAIRLSMSNVWIRPPNKQQEGRDAFEAWAATLLGPLAGNFSSWFMAAKYWQDGEYLRSMEAPVPAVVRNLIKTGRLASEGAKTIKGQNLLSESDHPELGWNELLGQAFGFSPRRLSEVYEANQAITAEKARLDTARTRLINKWVNSGNQMDRSEIFKGDIAKFNQDHPTHRIDGKQLVQSMVQRGRNARQTQSGLYLPKKQAGLRDLGGFAND